MSRRKTPPATGALRREIAGLAARMIAEDGIDDYGYAKRKAARSLGVGENEALPTNEEVEAELRDYLAIYHGDEQPELLRELRGAALEAMELLADFRPYLTGPVLEGTAGRYASIDLDLYADSAKDVEIMLLSHGIPYEPDERASNRPDAPEARLTIHWNDIPVRLSVYPLVAERRQTRSPHTGRTAARARIEAVAGLLRDERSPAGIPR